MKKTHEKSIFRVMNSIDMYNYSGVVIQVSEPHLFTNASGMAVFLVECVPNKEDYDQTTIAGQLETAKEEIEKLTESLQAAKHDNDRQQILNERLSDERELARADTEFAAALITELSRILGDMPKEYQPAAEILQNRYSAAAKCRNY